MLLFESRSHDLGVTYRGDLDWMIGFTDTLHTLLGTTANYSAVALLRTLQFTVTQAIGFCLQWSHPGNGIITVSLLLQITHDFLFS
jgi:hypothetical protein